MTSHLKSTGTQGEAARSAGGDVLRALIAMAGVALIAAYGGFDAIHGSADNDSMMRLVEVRDLLAGQGWFDLHQYRMGPEGGLLMHWSRLVDAPIAAIALVAATITGSQATGEVVVLIIWPLALYAVAFYLVLRIGRLTGGEEAVFPLTFIGAVTLYYVGVFAPGALDHHNVQLVLMLAMILFLQRAANGWQGGAAAGAAAVLMLAVGMETAPYVAVGGAFVAGWFLLRGDEARDAAKGFGLAFATTSLFVLVATVPSAQWGAAACDAFSLVQFSVGIVAGIGLFAVACLPARTLVQRALALAVPGVLVVALVGVYFPQCVSDPYADLAPRLQDLWLSAVGEAKPLWAVFAEKPESAAGHYTTVIIALVVLAFHIRRHGMRRETVLVGAMLGVALLVSIWQVRGSRFSLPLACVPLAMWVGDWRARAMREPGAANNAKMAGAWIASFHVTWMLLALMAWHLLAPANSGERDAKPVCYRQADYAVLAAMPRTRVLAISNLGASILRQTRHSVLAGPYHRNVEGNLAVLDAFTGDAAEALRVVRDNGVDIVAFCPGNSETAFLAARAPAGFLAQLVAGDVPDWMEIIPESAPEALKLYRVRQ